MISGAVHPAASRSTLTRQQPGVSVGPFGYSCHFKRQQQWSVLGTMRGLGLTCVAH